MIDEEATFEQFGYYSRDLKQQSHKRVVAVCDGCGKIRELRKGDYSPWCKPCARKGIPRTEETCKKISDAQKGKKLSEETRGKMSEAKKGKKRSEEFCKKLGDSRRGEKNAQWKGGVSFGKYCHKFNFKFKEDIRNKYDRKCLLCGKTELENGKRLSVHHVNLNKNCGCDTDITCQYAPLCVSCHSKGHASKGNWETIISNKMKCSLKGWYI
ncbi:MAG: NUMOD3 domain-containing DNA-binding protein [Methanosarcinales archaeon]